MRDAIARAMTPEQLRRRTTDLAIEVVKFCDPLWTTRADWFITEQLCRSITSMASNYRVSSRTT